MENDFLVTSIHRIILVDSREYPDNNISFFGPRTHNELIYEISTEATVFFNDEILDITPNSIRFLPKGDITKYEVRRKIKGDCIDIFFDTDKPISKKAFAMHISENKKILPLFKKIFSVWVAKNDGYYFECISILYRILSEMQKERYIPSQKYDLIKPATDYIESNFMSDGITSEKLASLCGISYSYVNRIFEKKFGVSPKKYIIQLKTNYACELLKEGSFNISSVAKMCGYEDIYYFSRQFKNIMGLSPTEYIKKYRSSK